MKNYDDENRKIVDIIDDILLKRKEHSGVFFSNSNPDEIIERLLDKLGRDKVKSELVGEYNDGCGGVDNLYLISVIKDDQPASWIKQLGNSTVIIPVEVVNNYSSVEV